MLTRSKTKAMKQPKSQAPKIPIQQSRQLQHTLFGSSIIFEDHNNIFLEGLTYKQIGQDYVKLQALQQLQNNLPAYNTMSQRQKKRYFANINNTYMEMLGSSKTNYQNDTNVKMSAQAHGNDVMHQDVKQSDDNSHQNNGVIDDQCKSVKFRAHDNFKVFDKVHKPLEVRYSKQYNCSN